MLKLDLAGVLFSLFVLGPRQWRWTLAAVAVAKLATLLTLIVWRVELTAYTMGGLFTQVELNGGPLSALLIGLAGPFACYAVAKLKARRPMGERGWFKQLLPWSELENPMAGTFAKYALLAALFSVFKAFS